MSRHLCFWSHGGAFGSLSHVVSLFLLDDTTRGGGFPSSHRCLDLAVASTRDSTQHLLQAVSFGLASLPSNGSFRLTDPFRIDIHHRRHNLQRTGRWRYIVIRVTPDTAIQLGNPGSHCVGMASNARRMSTLSQKFSSEEEWQDLIAWNGELYDPLFQGDVGIATTAAGEAFGGNSFTSDTHAPESVTSEQFYEPSTTTSLFDGPSSSDYVVSRPPSITEGPSSFDRGHSWLSGSPSYTTSATSPLTAQLGMPYQSSGEACESMLSPGYVKQPSGPHSN